MTKHQLSLIVIGVLGVVILVVGWFIGVSPQLERMNKANQQTAQLASTNDIAQARLDALKAASENLPAMQADVAAAAKEIPTSRDQRGLIRLLNDVSDSSGTDIQSVSVEDAAPYSAPSWETAPTITTGTLYTLPLTVSVTGNESQVNAFVKKLQALDRVLTVTSTDYQGSDDGSTLTIKAGVWVLVPTPVDNGDTDEG